MVMQQHFIISGTRNFNWIKFGVIFWWSLGGRGSPIKPTVFSGYVPGCLSPGCY